MMAANLTTEFSSWSENYNSPYRVYVYSAVVYTNMLSSVEVEFNVETKKDDEDTPSVFYEFIKDLPDVTDEFPNAKFDLVRDIFARIEREDVDSWMAIFEDADIAMPGVDPIDAVKALRYEIAYSMESLFSSKDALGPKLKQRLDTLSQYIKVRE